MSADRNMGIYYCPRCVCMRDSVLAEDATIDGDPTPDLECTVCGYVWGPNYIERVNGPTEIRPSLSVEDREAGMARLAERTMAYASRHGFPLENFTDPTIRIPRRNQGG